MTKYFVAGIGTGVGKTLVSAALVHFFEADYWKPVQCGAVPISDSQFILNSGVPQQQVFKERYFLQAPQSPHFAADLEKVSIQLDDFQLPEFTNEVAVIEGAGGILVPLNHQKDYVIDIAAKVNAEIILVVNHYLGSINHTLLSISFLKTQGYNLKGLIISGDMHAPSEKVIFNQGIPLLGRLPKLKMEENDFSEGIKSFEWYGK